MGDLAPATATLAEATEPSSSPWDKGGAGETTMAMSGIGWILVFLPQNSERGTNGGNDF